MRDKFFELQEKLSLTDYSDYSDFFYLNYIPICEISEICVKINSKNIQNPKYFHKNTKYFLLRKKTAHCHSTFASSMMIKEQKVVLKYITVMC